MSDPDATAALLEAARYLRGARPLDPSELRQYVVGGVDEGTAYTVLDAHAVDLGIRERSDGTFVPVADEPPTPTFDGVAALPERLTAAVEDCLCDAYGNDWYAGESGDRLRRSIRRFKSAYFAGQEVSYDRDAALGYAIYHLPGTYAKIQYVLDVLGRAQRLPSSARVLDVGAGTGGVALGLADYLGSDHPVDYRGLEPSEAATDIADRLMAETHRNFRWEFVHRRIEDAELGGPYDLVVLSNVLGELDEPRRVVRTLVEVVADDGSLVLLEPADERTSRLVRRVERNIVDEHDLAAAFAPALRLWPDTGPTDDAWSFDRQPSLEVPSFQRDLDEGPRAGAPERDPATGEFVNVDVRYAYAILRPDGECASPYRASRSRFARLAESADHVGDRVNLAVVKLSNSLREDDGHPLYVIGDGSQDEEHFAVHTRPTSLNRAIASAGYGDILEVEHGLLLWNEDESAYNVVIDDETIVDRVPTGITPPTR